LDETDIEKQALTALKQGDLAIMMRLIVSGFDLNGRIGTKYPLHVAVESVRLSLMVVLRFSESSNPRGVSIPKWCTCGCR
jgi:hypothetical protein